MVNPPEDGEKPRKPKRRAKSVAPTYKQNDEGGYGNPPVKDQYQKGNPGGPGRPKGSNSLNAALKKMFRGKVALLNGPKVRFSEAFLLAARKAILSGGVKGIELGLQLNREFGIQPVPVQEEAAEEPDFDLLNDLEFVLFGGLLTRAHGKEPAPSTMGKTFSALGLCIVSLRPDGHVTISKVEDEPPLLERNEDPSLENGSDGGTLDPGFDEHGTGFWG